VTVGTIKTRTLRSGERLAALRNDLIKPIQEINPFLKAAIEAPAYGKSMGADLLGQVRGVFLLLLYDCQIDTVLVAPKSVKKFATRSGDAEKDAMITAAQERWPAWQGSPKKDDEADALWMAEVARGCLFPKGMTRAQLEVIHQLKQLRREDLEDV
jgi:Holliday junction resolvasome RuvABC endonuclease subunit